MKIINVKQGSPEWLAVRAQYNTASEAPAMMGASRYQTRIQLMQAKKFGSEAVISRQQQAAFDRGHETEALARLLVEDSIGEDLYTVTMASDCGRYLASMDGRTMTGETGYEHKLWNQGLAAQVAARDLDPHYYWQLEHQLLVDPNMEQIIFVCSDGTLDNFVSMVYKRVAGRAEALAAAWAQFDADRADYQHIEVIDKPVGTAVAALPVLSVTLTGEVTSSNLAIYKKTALSFIDSIKTDLKTDQDFADAEKMIKFCDNTEGELDAVKRLALSQTTSIAELFEAIDSLKAGLRAKRLALEKGVKSQKENMRAAIQQEGTDSFKAHWKEHDTRFGVGRGFMPAIPVDFVGKMNGKKSVAGWRDAMTNELARAKLHANEVAGRIQTNLNTLHELADDHYFLFNDTKDIIQKAPDDCKLLIETRISRHNKEVQDKKDAEVLAEAARVAAQAATLAAKQAKQAAQALDDSTRQTPAAAVIVWPAAPPAVLHSAPQQPVTVPVVPRSLPAEVTPPTLTLGAMSERFGFNLTASFLATLGFVPVKVKTSSLFHEDDFQAIGIALIAHIKTIIAFQPA